jgi:dienelactone hydrolase
MAEVLFFHHAQGLTQGIRSLADQLRAVGHVVHTPDLYDGATFATVDEGVANARKIGFDNILERGARVAESLPRGIVYAGISLGVMPAQKLAQTRSGAKGAILLSAAISPSEFGGPWPQGVPLQIHMMDRDKWVEEGDLDAAKGLATEVPGAELHLYPGDQHLFMDSSLSDYDEGAARLLTERVCRFLSQAT